MRVSIFAVSITLICTGVHGFAQERIQPTAISLKVENYNSLSTDGIRILKEYVEHYNNLKASYENLRIEGEMQYYAQAADKENRFPPAPDSSLKLLARGSFVYSAKKSSLFRLDGKRQAEGQDSEERLMAFVTPEESYLLGVDPQTNEPFLKGYGKNSKTYRSELDYYWFHIAPFSVETRRLEHVLFSPGSEFKIRSVKEKSEGDHDLVVIQTRIENDRGRSDYEITLDKNLNWAVSKVDCSYYDPGNPEPVCVKEQRCSYNEEERSRELPFLKKASFSVVAFSEDRNRREVQRREFSITRISTDPVPDSEFNARKLLKYQIAETTNERSYVMVGLTIGIILVLLGMIVRRRMSST